MSSVIVSSNMSVRARRQRHPPKISRNREDCIRSYSPPNNLVQSFIGHNQYFELVASEGTAMRKV